MLPRHRAQGSELCSAVCRALSEDGSPTSRSRGLNVTSPNLPSGMVAYMLPFLNPARYHSPSSWRCPADCEAPRFLLTPSFPSTLEPRSFFSPITANAALGLAAITPEPPALMWPHVLDLYTASAQLSASTTPVITTLPPLAPTSPPPVRNRAPHLYTTKQFIHP